MLRFRVAVVASEKSDLEKVRGADILPAAVSFPKTSGPFFRKIANNSKTKPNQPKRPAAFFLGIAKALRLVCSDLP